MSDKFKDDCNLVLVFRDNTVYAEKPMYHYDRHSDAPPRSPFGKVELIS